MITKLSDKVQELLGYYVYALRDPRKPNEYFYIGKGKGERVLQHVQEALNTQNVNDKCDVIRDIVYNAGLEVEYDILRHNIKTEDEAYDIESTCIDLYNSTHPTIKLTNIVTGHHQNDFGIQSLDDVILRYDCKEIEFPELDSNQYVCLNGNSSYVEAAKAGKDIYQYIKEYWMLNFNKVQTIDYVLVIYKGIVRNVYKPIRWYKATKQSDFYSSSTGTMIPKVGFDGIEIKDSPFVNTNIEKYVKFSQRGSLYYNYEQGKKLKKSRNNLQNIKNEINNLSGSEKDELLNYIKTKY